jgi:diacylglycerol kinase family enzyme
LVSDAKQFDRVVVSGGDGTVMQVINGMVGTAVPLAIVPGGTGNVLGQAVGVNADLRLACEEALAESNYLPLDLGLLNDNLYFALRLSIGYEAFVTKDTTAASKSRWGKLAYLAQAVSHAVRLPTTSYRIDADGTILDMRAESVWVANTSTLGILNLELDPAISLSDRQLDLCIFRFSAVRNIQRILLWLFKHERLPPSIVTQLPVTSYVNIVAASRQPVQVDGDAVGHTPCRIRVVPDGMRICAHTRMHH